MAKVLIFDIEASDLVANAGFMICASWKWLGEKTIHTASIHRSSTFKKDPTNDKEVIEALSEAIMEADMWVAFYGKRFDFPFIQSRRLFHGLPPLPEIPYYDPWFTARYKLKLRNNRLATVSSFLGLESKTTLQPWIWVRASAGHLPSIRYVIDHCEQDIVVLEQAYLKLAPLASNHPNLNLMHATDDCCPVCGGNHLQKRGSYIAKTRKYQRYYCTDCGKWSRARINTKVDYPVKVV